MRNEGFQLFFHGTSRVNEKGHLEIGGVDTVELAKTYGTPLYIYDVALIRARARAFKEAFRRHGVRAQVAYASKAFSSVAMVQLAAEEQLSLDVVSGGELYTALAAGFPPERIHFHGNNKSRDELAMALEHGVGCIVADNFYELELIEQLVGPSGRAIPVLLRVTPGVEAHTHDYILTGQEDSKFGFDLNNGQADEAFRRVMASAAFQLLGVHCHIGSQIFETTGFVLAARKVFAKLAEWHKTCGFVPAVVNLGGGFGIRYTDEDDPIPVSAYVDCIVNEVKTQAEVHQLPLPEIWIEPGRSLVGDAGTTIYTIGSRKEVPNVRTYIAVDGGMSDNIRPALYEAAYTALVANRRPDPQAGLVRSRVVGKHCESGDVVVRDVDLPADLAVGDVLAVPATGAYGRSMASNYNLFTRPGVRWVRESESGWILRPETIEDLLRLEG